MGLIVHITSQARWDDADDTYRHPLLEVEGFIHCSAPEQVVRVANAVGDEFEGSEPLVLLCIDESRVKAAVIYEGSGTETFPHTYGALNTDAVIDSVPFPRNDTGEFERPSAVTQLADRF